MTEIKARDGYYLTQVAEVGAGRIYVTAIKGENVDGFNWREATQEEKEAFEKEQEPQTDKQ